MAILSETGHSKGGKTHNQTAWPEEKGATPSRILTRRSVTFIVT
jgi:hypothetical protein